MRTTHEEMLAMLRFLCASTLVLAACALLAGCDGDPVSPMDAGDAGDSDAGTDARVVPSVPRVLDTAPADGQREVPRDTAIAVTFDRPMRADAGAVTARVGDTAVALGAASWDAERQTVTVTPTEPLPPGARVDVTVASFVSDEGAALAAPVAFGFETRDDAPPFVTSATPTEAARDVDPELAELVIAFSEPLREGGLARLEGGPGTLGRAAWREGALHLPVSGLAADTAYRVVLEGFRDVAGNPLDGVPVLGDGALDFETGGDVTAPTVVSSSPSEGQLDVRVGLVTRVWVDFSEPMDETVGRATLETDGRSEPLALAWSRGGTRAALDVAGLLRIDTAYRVVLADFADRAGNPFDGSVYLGDGAIDFTTGAGALSPFVAHTEPIDGTTVLAIEQGVVRVVFSEAMDTARTTVELDDGLTTQTVEGTWNEAGTILSLDARGRIHAGSRYTVDLSAFHDATGSPLDIAHPYLADGVLEFETALGTGERCGDALSMAQGTAIPNGVEWVIPSGAVSFNDGSAGACAASVGGPDVLVHYRKSTPASTAGGTVLHVTVTNPVANNTINVAVFQGRCDVDDASTLRRCVSSRNPWEVYVDGGPGDYFIWVGRTASLSLNGATIRVEERPLPAPGESCLAPWDTSAPASVYTAPTTPGTPHRWVLPSGAAAAYDRGLRTGDESAISCAASPRHGPDTVVRLDKTTDTSVLTVRVSAAGTGTSPVRTHVEVRDACEPDSGSALACYPELIASSGVRELTLRGPAGGRHVWLAPSTTSGVFPGATVEMVELEPGLGDTCATAIPLAPGATHSVSATRPYRADAPACLASGGLTWFRYTPTQGLGLLRTNGATAGAVVDPSGQLVRCEADDTVQGLPVFGVPGQPICVALASAATVTQITIEEIPYAGVRGAPTEVVVTRPSGVASVGTGWLAVQGSALYRGQTTPLLVPTGGGAMQQVTFPGSVSRNGGAVLTRPDGLYALSSSSATTGSRLFRITDAAGALLETPVPIDVLPDGFAYPNRRFDALAWDGTRFLAATAQLTTATANPDCCTTVTFWAIPIDGTPPTQIGSNDYIDDVSALAADATNLYVYGRSAEIEAVWRLRRDQLDEPATIPAALLSGLELSNDNGALYADSTTRAGVLYLRLYARTSGATHGADVYAIVGPDEDTPRWVGPLWTSGSIRTDSGLAYDPSGPTLWVVDTTSPFTTDGRWLRLD